MQDDLESRPATAEPANLGESALGELDVLGILEGVDKASIRGRIPCSWDYLRHYEALFAEYRRRPINLIEIGVKFGSSLRLWRRHFEVATIVGLDIDPDCQALEEGRIKVRIGSQNNPAFLLSTAEEFPPTIVIDDGSHIASDILTSFETLFPKLLPGGVYVIEDLVFHFTVDGHSIGYPPPQPDSPCEAIMDYFNRLIVARAAHVDHLTGADDRLNELYGSIDSISVVGGALFIKKRSGRDFDRAIAVFEQQLKEGQAEGPERYCYLATRYAEYLVTYRVQLGRALELAREVVRLDPRNVYGLKVLNAVLVTCGDRDGAMVVAGTLTTMGEEAQLPKVHSLHVRYPH